MNFANRFLQADDDKLFARWGKTGYDFSESSTEKTVMDTDERQYI